MWPLLVQHLTKGYCLRSAWHKSSVVMKTVYVRRKSSRRVSAEEGKKVQGRTYYWGGKEYILHLLCMAGIGFPSPFQAQSIKNASKFKFQTVPNMLPLQRSDHYLRSTFWALKEPTSRNMHKISHSSGINKKESLSWAPPFWLALLHAKQPLHHLSCSGNAEEKLFVTGERNLWLPGTVVNVYTQ